MTPESEEEGEGEKGEYFLDTRLAFCLNSEFGGDQAT